MRRVAESQGPAEVGPNPFLVSAIKNKEVLSFLYEGKLRIVEPQTYGVSAAGKHVLRLHQIGGESHSGELFEVAKMSRLRRTGAHFEQALPQRDRDETAMIQVFATVERPGKLEPRDDGQQSRAE